MRPGLHGHYHPPRRLGRRQRRWVNGISLWLALSGLGWLFARYLLPGSQPLPDLPPPSGILWLRPRCAAAVGLLVIFGMLINGHIRQGLRARLNRSTGLTLVGLCAALTLTGYGLYYVASDAWRAWLSPLHWALGLGSVVLFVLHRAIGRQLVAA